MVLYVCLKCLFASAYLLPPPASIWHYSVSRCWAEGKPWFFCCPFLLLGDKKQTTKGKTREAKPFQISNTETIEGITLNQAKQWLRPPPKKFFHKLIRLFAIAHQYIWGIGALISISFSFWASALMLNQSFTMNKHTRYVNFITILLSLLHKLLKSQKKFFFDFVCISLLIYVAGEVCASPLKSKHSYIIKRWNLDQKQPLIQDGR